MLLCLPTQFFACIATIGDNLLEARILESQVLQCSYRAFFVVEIRGMDCDTHGEPQGVSDKLHFASLDFLMPIYTSLMADMLGGANTSGINDAKAQARDMIESAKSEQIRLAEQSSAECDRLIRENEEECAKRIKENTEETAKKIIAIRAKYNEEMESYEELQREVTEFKAKLLPLYQQQLALIMQIPETELDEEDEEEYEEEEELEEETEETEEETDDAEEEEAAAAESEKEHIDKILNTGSFEPVIPKENLQDLKFGKNN